MDNYLKQMLKSDLTNTNILIPLDELFRIVAIDEKNSKLIYGNDFSEIELEIPSGNLISLMYDRPEIAIFREPKSKWLLIIKCNKVLKYIFELDINGEIVFGKNITPSDNLMGFLNNISEEN